MKIALGNMDRKITIRQSVQVQEADGSIRDVFTDVTTLYAQRIPKGASEPYEGDEKRQVQSDQFVVHKTQTNLSSAENRLVFDGREYEITGIEEPEVADTFNRGRYLLLHAQAKGAVSPTVTTAFNYAYNQKQFQ